MTHTASRLRLLSIQAAAALSLATWLPAGHAARPMITDDARIVDPKSCQLESWVKRNPDSTEYWALPGCNFTGNLEVTVGGARGNDAAGTRTTAEVIQGKTLFKTLQPDGWAWGLVLGSVRDPVIRSERNLLGDVYAYIPASFAFRGDALVVHTNLGVLREQESRRHRLTWGTGVEAQLDGQTWLIAEAFGQGEGRPFHQVGLRRWLVRDRVQVDATYGNRFGSSRDERWLSFGLRLLSPPFLP